ncbi:MAG TPA: sulfatase-like hydrolase/transferase [Acidobacteriota bacterium]|nr:sulfatase-like hydrolase/transferase [Acidobacteriota bacterium]
MSKKTSWCCFIVYLAILGSYCGLEIDTFVEDLPFFQWNTFLIFFNVLFVLLVPPLVYALLNSRPSLWNRRGLRNTVLTANAVYFIFAILFSLYKSARHMDFDFYFFWYNIAVALSVLWKLYAPWLIVLVLCVVGFVIFQKAAFGPVVSILKKSPKKAWPIFVGITAASLFCQLITVHSVRGSTAGFLYASFFSDRHLRNEYRDRYEAHMSVLRADGVKTTGKGDASILGDIVIFVQQESLNSLLIGPKTTPQLLRASRDGVLLNPIYGNSIQSERGYECILCGVPPSIGGDLVDEYSPGELKNLSCLPRIFKTLGYHPIVFYSGNRNPRVMRLFESIGFEKILAGDIVQPGDVMYDWGYREDHFFTRVDEYLQKHHTNEKLFIFITASATNHTPFKVHDDKLLDKIPYPDPKRFEDRFSNTIFAQDAYLGHLYDIYTKHYAQHGTLIALSDHSWPIERHKHNIYNERGAYEENFLAAMLFVPPVPMRNRFAIGSTVLPRFSQIDILPTVLDLIGLKENLWLGESFAPWLLASADQERSMPRRIKMSVQPYGGGFISAVKYPQKYLFDVLGNDVKVYDLQKDPGESSPAVQNVDDYIHLISEFFKPESSNAPGQKP